MLPREYGTARALRAHLADRFPAAITPSKTPFKIPLKIGIHKDLYDTCPDLTSWHIHLFLAVYTSGKKYQEAQQVEGAVRVGLDGVGDGYVTDAQAARAKHILAKIDAIQTRRRNENMRMAA